MNFQPNASGYLVGRACHLCDTEIETKDSVYFDIDGDNERVSITVYHAWCRDFVTDAVNEAIDKTTEKVWNEAVQLLTHNDKQSALEALQFRHSCAVRKLKGESGARVVEALGLVS